MSFLGGKWVISDIDWGQGVSTSDNLNAISVSLKIISWKFRKHTYFLGHIDPSGGRTSNWILRVFWNNYDARLYNDWIWHRICEKIDYCDLRHRSWVKSSKHSPLVSESCGPFGRNWIFLRFAWQKVTKEDVIWYSFCQTHFVSAARCEFIQKLIICAIIFFFAISKLE